MVVYWIYIENMKATHCIVITIILLDVFYGNKVPNGRMRSMRKKEVLALSITNNLTARDFIHTIKDLVVMNGSHSKMGVGGGRGRGNDCTLPNPQNSEIVFRSSYNIILKCIQLEGNFAFD